jgi:hypothetical protein
MQIAMKVGIENRRPVGGCTHCIHLFHTSYAIA